MTNKPRKVSFDALAETISGNAVVFGSKTPAAVVASKLGLETRENLEQIDSGVETLIVVGGGEVLDRCKYWRNHTRPQIILVAIPSLWGSGAEVSPIVVLNTPQGEKEIHIGDEYLPDIRSVLPELTHTLTEQHAFFACGDVWAHALEGFLSPLASNELRAEMANLIEEILALPLGNDARWFEPSALACAGQARSSVGLVHGLAHTLESVKRKQNDQSWGHARLCSRLLWPVMEYNRSHSDKWDILMDAHQLDSDAILARLNKLYDDKDYQALCPEIENNWKTILRDPCSRTNSTLVRPKALNYFLSSEFKEHKL